MGAEEQRTEGQGTGEPGLRATRLRGFPPTSLPLSLWTCMYSREGHGWHRRPPVPSLSPFLVISGTKPVFFFSLEHTRVPSSRSQHGGGTAKGPLSILESQGQQSGCASLCLKSVFVLWDEALSLNDCPFSS